MFIVLSSLALCALIGGILFSIDIGHRIGVRRRLQNAQRFRPVHPAIEGAVFGLMGLLIGFTFSGAGGRFENRRKLAVDEANAIGTTYLRLDLLPPATQPRLREDFRKYVRSRLTVYQQIPDLPAVRAALDRTAVLQAKLWEGVVEALRDSTPPDKTLVLSSLNEMLDLAMTRSVALTTHPPAAIFVMLGLTVVASSILAGYSMTASETRDWMSTITLAVVLGLAVYLILDYEFPRVGFLRIDHLDQVLVDTLNEMK
jgi:hypothetical protein